MTTDNEVQALRDQLGALSLEMSALTMSTTFDPQDELQRVHHEGYDESTRFWKWRLAEILHNY